MKNMKHHHKKYSTLIKIAKGYFTTARGSHGWDHVERVLRLSERIGRQEGADLDILLPAAILHDIGRAKQDRAKGKLCHAKWGAAEADKILQKRRSSGPERVRIVECIRAHRFRDSQKPVSLEAKVLYDADKIDSLGAAGVGRAFLFAGEVGARLVNRGTIKDSSAYSREDTAYREYMVKLRKLPARAKTSTGKKIARERARVMREFFREFVKETKD